MDSIQADIFLEQVCQQTVGGWRMISKLGNEKSALVMLAQKGDQTAAIKIFHRELTERFGKETQLERIKRELSLVGKRHPNLVQIIDGGECPATGLLYVVMEPLPYENLKTLLHQIPEEKIGSIISQIAAAAKFLEEQELVHRDIKPENIAISADFSTAILLDLGVIRPIGTSSLTDDFQKQFIGTLQYSSPEFMLRNEGESATDWRAVTFYQLGAVLHDLIMKKPIFEEYAEPYTRLVIAIRDIEPQIKSNNGRLDRLAQYCLTKNPSDRTKLVSWEKFDRQAITSTESEEHRSERLSNFRTYAASRLSARGANIPSLPGVDTRISNLRRTSRKFEFEAAKIISKIEFPTRKTNVKFLDTEFMCEVTYQFDKSDILGINSPFMAAFRIFLSEEASTEQIYTFSFRAAWSPQQSNHPASEWTNFFSGTETDLFETTLVAFQLNKLLESIYTSQNEDETQSG